MVLLLLVSVLKSIVLLHYHFPKYVCSAQYSCFLEFLDFMFIHYYYYYYYYYYMNIN